MRRRHTLVISLALSTLNGCAARGAPSFGLFGAFFPAWMFGAALGILASVAARAIFVLSGEVMQ
jgi:hypothetical protein